MASNISKADVNIDDNTTVSSHDASLANPELPGTNLELLRAIMKKIDRWLVGFHSLVYVFRVVDSSNYSNAAIINLESSTGIKKQLGLSHSQWAWTLSIFSYSYMIFEPTNTLAMKIFSPSRWMFVLILSWGISACSSAAAQDFTGMMCVRFAIGLAEAGFYPAVLYHIASWYKPIEMPQRIAISYSLGQLSPAVSRLLAYAIGFMDGPGDLAGWRWLSLLEGLPVIILSVGTLWLPDYAKTAPMLTEEERDFFQNRLEETAPSGRRGHWDFESLKRLLKDPTFYTFSLFWICHGIGRFGIGTVLPTVIYELGFTTTSNSQLMNLIWAYINLLLSRVCV
ncbi:major facilitator superfamily domain-containing protein [Daldinia bambusicola]|nr:major facilitator superfamily domain-containing protein [Daldinia bambusicola]